MSDNEATGVDEKMFCVDRAKQGRAACKKCKGKCVTGELRIAKLAPNPFGTGKMKQWHHVHCIFEQFLKQRLTTRRIESTDDIEGYDKLSSEDQKEIRKHIRESESAIAEKHGSKATTSKAKTVTTPKKKDSNVNVNKPLKNASTVSKSSVKEKKVIEEDLHEISSNSSSATPKTVHKDNTFREFRTLIANITNVSSFTAKTSLVRKQFSEGSDGQGFKGDIKMWCRLLLPGVVKRIYNLQSKQIIKLFSRIFNSDQNAMIDTLKKGDIGETIQQYFEESKSFPPAKKSTLTLADVDNFLYELSELTREEEQIAHFRKFSAKCTSRDLKVTIRLIKHDLRMNAGAKHILDGIHPDAYEAYQASRNIDSVIDRCLKGSSKDDDRQQRVKATISLMTPVFPMLAEPCKSIEQAMKKCANGIFSEIKYDGERVQVHKEGSTFKYFSRSLKPVLAHKIAHFKDYIPKAFPHGNDLILDSEILMVDKNTGNPLPFGTLGIHKKSKFKDANVCLFVFDCIYYNGETLTNRSLDHRKKILQENMKEIENHIVFSEYKEIYNSKELSEMINATLKSGLEGLVLKDRKSIYEPGKRHWLKVKKDYLADGAMADSADLIVLGAWYGTGKKAGMMSVFLMGCYDEKKDIFCTVTKVHTGHDDKTLERLQSELVMLPIDNDMSSVPGWLNCTKTMIPDFVARNPKNQPVWEITGAEFTQHDVHTADGISVRFPRVTRIREDKSWQDATSLKQLKKLYKTSKEVTDIKLDYQPSNQSETGSSVRNVADASSENKVEGKAKKRKKDSTKLKEVPKKIVKTEETIIVDEKEQNSNFSVKFDDTLCELFHGIKLLVEKHTEKHHEDPLQYFTAYGGRVLNENEWQKATYVLHVNGSVDKQMKKAPKTARHVTSNWITDSINDRTLLDYRPYSVVWEPNKS